MIKGLAHACFNTRDLDRIVRFYTEGLGLSVAFEFRNEKNERTGVYIKLGNRSFLEFFLGDLPAPDAFKTPYKHICLEVDDLAASVAEFRAHGVKMTDPMLGSDHSWQAWTADPDGNAIEFHQYTPESWQTPHLA